MAHLIDKDALVEEIEKSKIPFKRDIEDGIYPPYLCALMDFEDLLDTIKVKDDSLLTEKKIEKELAEEYISIFDKKFGNKLPILKGRQLAKFKNFINTCEQTFHMKYFDYHATQGKLFEKLALLWAVWGKEHLNHKVKEMDLEKEIELVKGDYEQAGVAWNNDFDYIAKHFFELGLKVQKGE